MTQEKKVDNDDTTSVRVRMFASAREAVGKEEIMIKLTSHYTTAEDLKRNILDMYPALSLKKITFVLAVNHKFVVNDSTAIISPHDEVAVLPPISGG